MTNTAPIIVTSNAYDQFHCIASECPMTCCQEWTIGVDDRTLHRWRSTSIDNVLLNRFVEKDFTGHHRIRLNEDHRCPWLNEQGLCRIVLTHGDECLSVTCNTFPRQRHAFYDRLENSLLNGCPEVLNLLRSEIDPLPENVACTDSLNNSCLDSLLDNDDYLTLSALRAARYYICRLLGNSSMSLNENLLQGLLWITDLWENEPEAEAVWSLLHTDPQQVTMSISPSPGKYLPDILAECSELFLDFTENYRKEDRYTTILRPLCQSAEELLSHRDNFVSSICKESDFANFQHLNTVYDSFFRSLLVSDCYGSLLSEETDLTGMRRNYEWILLRWVCIRHALLLAVISKDNSNSDTPLSWASIQEIICSIYRMTSFNETDIGEALKSMFDGPFLQTEYCQFILGL